MLPPDSIFFCASLPCLRIHVMKITYMVFQMPQILMHYQIVFQKHKQGHNSCKYCSSLPTCLRNYALLTEAFSAMYIPELHPILLMIKNRRKVGVLVEQIRFIVIVTGTQSEKFKVLHFPFSPRNLE